MTDDFRTKTIKLWSQDYSEVLHTTESQLDAVEFFLASSHDWLPIVIDYGKNWRSRWSGRIERREGEAPIVRRDSDYLEYLTTWPTLVHPRYANRTFAEYETHTQGQRMDNR